MKATLEFNLPKERDEYEIAVAAPEIYAAICEIDNYLRNEIKHGKHSEDVINFAASLRREYLADTIWRMK